MRKFSIFEFFLALFAGRDRAAAIYGDLKEMATNRGCAWFVLACFRTLTVVSWRIVAAVVAGMVVRQLLVNTLSALPLGHTAPWPDVPALLIFWLSPTTLWFILPFAAVLYGVRDRFVCLTAIATLATTITSLFVVPVSLVYASVTLILAGSIFLLMGWWKPMAVLVATVVFAFVLGAAAGNLSMSLLSHGYIVHYGHGISGLEPMLAFRGSMLLSAYLCARLHGWLLAPGDRLPA